MEIITKDNLDWFCKDTVKNHFQQKPSPKEQESIDKYTKNGIVTDELLMLFCLWELECYGDMLPQPILFQYENKIIEGYYNDGEDIKIKIKE